MVTDLILGYDGQLCFDFNETMIRNGDVRTIILVWLFSWIGTIPVWIIIKLSLCRVRPRTETLSIRSWNRCVLMHTFAENRSRGNQEPIGLEEWRFPPFLYWIFWRFSHKNYDIGYDNSQNFNQLPFQTKESLRVSFSSVLVCTITKKPDQKRLKWVNTNLWRKRCSKWWNIIFGLFSVKAKFYNKSLLHIWWSGTWLPYVVRKVFP